MVQSVPDVQGVDDDLPGLLLFASRHEPRERERGHGNKGTDSDPSAHTCLHIAPATSPRLVRPRVAVSIPPPARTGPLGIRPCLPGNVGSITNQALKAKEREPRQVRLPWTAMRLLTWILYPLRRAADSAGATGRFDLLGRTGTRDGDRNILLLRQHPVAGLDPDHIGSGLR